MEKLLGIDLPEGPFDTLAGFVVDKLGHMPEVGDEIQREDFVLKVAAMDGRRIEWLTVSQAPRDELEELTEPEE